MRYSKFQNKWATGLLATDREAGRELKQAGNLMYVKLPGLAPQGLWCI